MTLPVSYMGTKRQLAEYVKDVVNLSPPGPLLDVFSGMCAIATAVAPARQIWANDLQVFAQAVSQAHFCSSSAPPSRLDAAAWTLRAFSGHVSEHCAIARLRLAVETKLLDDGNADGLHAEYEIWERHPKLPAPTLYSASLFRDNFAGSYFGLSQAIEIDGLRFAADKALSEQSIDNDQHLWMMLALAVAISKASTSTGHFAQPLSPKSSNIARFASQRAISIKSEWLKALGALRPIGSREWRSSNRAIRGEAVETLVSLRGSEVLPAVVYADPPYTNDQYSRYYHVFETLMLYDYPLAEGRGRYRPDRAVSSFSLSRQVKSSLAELIKTTACLGCDLVLSYPLDGLMPNSRDILPELMQLHYGRQPVVYEIDHRHSTMGASKGAGKRDVTELIYRAFH